MTKAATAKLTRVGNQLCLPLPDDLAGRLGWADGTEVFLHDADPLGLWLAAEDQTEDLAELGELVRRLNEGAADVHSSVERAVSSQSKSPT